MRPSNPRLQVRYIALSGVVLALTLPSNAANAQSADSAKPKAAGPTVSAKTQTGQLLEYTVCGSAATFSLDVSTGTLTMVELPLGFDKHLYKRNTGWAIKRDGNKLYIGPPSNTPAKKELSLRIRASKPIPFEATLHTRAVKHIRGVKDNVVIHHQLDKARFGKRPEDNPCPLLEGFTPLQRMRIRAFDRQRGESRAIGVPDIEHVVRSGEGVPVALPMYELEDGNLIIDFKVANQNAATIDVDEVRVRDRHGDEMSSKIWRWDDKGKPIAEKGLAIAGFQEERASIYIPNADEHQLEPMWVEFRGTRGGAPFMTTVQVGTFRQMTPEEIEQMKRDEELRRKNEERKARAWERARRARQRSIVVRVLGGAFWTDDAIADTEAIAGTSMTGVGVRFQKGYGNSLALEVEGIGAMTEHARFQDANWNNTLGEIVRSASFFQIKASGAVRLGDRYVTAIRLGVGIQGVNYDSSFTSGGTTMEGPGGSFEIDGVWSFGASFDLPVGKSWVLGVGATYTDGINRDAWGLNGGLHLGYRWQP